MLLVCFASAPLYSDKKKKKTSDDEGMIPEVSTKPKKKKKGEDETQTLPSPKEAPSAVVVDTDRLFFQVSPLSAKGLLSAQAREAMRTLLRSNHGSNIVKLRAFVAGSGDMRRIQEIAGEVFTEKHVPLPTLAVVQVGALPMEGAQVIIESTGVDKKPVNPNGVAFLAGQAAKSVEQSVVKLRAALSGGGMDSGDVLRVTCFVSSLEESTTGRAALDAAFTSAAVNVVQMQRFPVTPAAECEAVARVKTAAQAEITFLNPSGLETSPNYSQLTIVHAPKIVFSSMQLAFGTQEPDIKLAFDRLQRALGALDANLGHLAMSHVYLTSMAVADKVRTVRKSFFNAEQPPASTLLPFEALPSLDASVGIDVIAIPNPH